MAASAIPVVTPPAAVAPHAEEPAAPVDEKWARVCQLLLAFDVPVAEILTMDAWHNRLTEDERDRLRNLLPAGPPAKRSDESGLWARTATTDRDAAAVALLGGADVFWGNPLRVFDRHVRATSRMVQEADGTALSAFEHQQLALHARYYRRMCQYKARLLADVLAGKRALLGDAVVHADVDHLRNRYYTELRRHRRIHEQPGGPNAEALAGRARKPPVRRREVSAQTEASNTDGASS